jgi:hypothetical protein
MLPFIITNQGITIVFSTGRPVSISAEDPSYAQIRDLLKAGAGETEILEVLDAAKQELQESIETIGDSGVAIRSDGLVTLEGQVIDNSLTRRMLTMREEGFDLKPMAAFLVNLQKNPSYRARKELYTFLEVGQLPLTPDGCFLAYKVVRPDYKDYHTGTFDNSVGQVLSMPREEVDDDCNHTCSAGLHFCSLDYLQHFGGTNGHVMILKINPADVVSIPADYNNTKGRCCRYEVVGEYTGYRRQNPRPLFDTSVWVDGEVDDEEDDVPGHYVEVLTPEGLEIHDEGLEQEEAMRIAADLALEGKHGYVRNSIDEVVKAF